MYENNLNVMNNQGVQIKTEVHYHFYLSVWQKLIIANDLESVSKGQFHTILVSL